MTDESSLGRSVSRMRLYQSSSTSDSDSDQTEMTDNSPSGDNSPVHHCRPCCVAAVACRFSSQFSPSLHVGP